MSERCAELSCLFFSRCDFKTCIFLDSWTFSFLYSIPASFRTSDIFFSIICLVFGTACLSLSISPIFSGGLPSLASSIIFSSISFGFSFIQEGFSFFVSAIIVFGREGF